MARDATVLPQAVGHAAVTAAPHGEAAAVVGVPHEVAAAVPVVPHEAAVGVAVAPREGAPVVVAEPHAEAPRREERDAARVLQRAAPGAMAGLPSAVAWAFRRGQVLPWPAP